MMGEEQFDRVKHLFLTALELPDEQRELWLRYQCGGDSELFREIRSLLKHDSPSNDPLENSLDREIYVDPASLGCNFHSEATSKRQPIFADGDRFVSKLSEISIFSHDEMNAMEQEISLGNQSSNPQLLASKYCSSVDFDFGEASLSCHGVIYAGDQNQGILLRIDFISAES